MIPFIVLARHGSRPSGSFPRLSYIFLIPALGALGAGIYFAAQYWIGSTWDVYTDKGNIMYHDSMCFLSAAMMLCLAAICVLKFLMWHGPWKKE